MRHLNWPGVSPSLFLPTNLLEKAFVHIDNTRKLGGWSRVEHGKFFDQIIRSDSLLHSETAMQSSLFTEILINDYSPVVHCWGHNPHMCSDQVWKLLTSIFLSFFGIIWELSLVASVCEKTSTIPQADSNSVTITSSFIPLS